MAPVRFVEWWFHPVKALTLTQPWATLVAIGAKCIETRSWGTSYRGPLAIHAAKGIRKVHVGRFNAYDAGLSGDSRTRPWTMLEAERGEQFPRSHLLRRGVVLATCNLVDVLPVHDYLTRTPEAPDGRYLLNEIGGLGVRCLGVFGPNGYPAEVGVERPEGLNDFSRELPYGDYTPGRFAWFLEDVEPWPEPLPVRGALGLWELSDESVSSTKGERDG